MQPQGRLEFNKPIDIHQLKRILLAMNGSPFKLATDKNAIQLSGNDEHPEKHLNNIINNYLNEMHIYCSGTISLRHDHEIVVIRNKIWLMKGGIATAVHS